MVIAPHIMVGLERMLDYRGVGLERFHCTLFTTEIHYVNRVQDNITWIPLHTTIITNIRRYVRTGECTVTCHLHSLLQKYYVNRVEDNSTTC